MTTKENKLEYDYCLLQYKKTGDKEWSDKIMNMIISGKAQVKVFENEIKFMAAARFKNKCTKCGVYIKHGEPHFYQFNKNWHEACASEEEKNSCSFYQSNKPAPSTSINWEE